MENLTCSECGAHLEKGKTCRSYFEKMIGWDFSDFKSFGKIHHLTVLCYYLQHPSLYSSVALGKAKSFLKEIVEEKVLVDDLYRLESDVFSSSKRDWKVEGSLKDRGIYSPQVKWSMTAFDIISRGKSLYFKNVFKWANLIYSDLKSSGNLN